MKYLKQRDERGFTLVEIAIVLVIIGLLLGGVMKGQTLIQQAKVKNVMNQVDGYRAAIMGFYDRYGMLPGDENNPNIPAFDTNNGNFSGQIQGNAERFYMFQDLQLAGFISGNYTGVNVASHAFGDQLYLAWFGNPAGAPTGHYFRLDNLPWDVALEIDMKLDDGIYNTGSVVGTADYTVGNGTIPIFYLKL